MVYRRQVGVSLAALLVAAMFLVLSASARGESAEEKLDEAPDGTPYAAGELLVTYKEDAAGGGVGRSATVEDEIPEIDVRVLEFPELKNERAERVRERILERKKRELERDPAVESVEYNYVYTGSYTPNDRRFRQQWGLKKTGFERAWNRARGGGARVAVVDSGFAMGHRDLRRKVAARYDFVNDNRTVEDLHGHGTHIAGIVGARTGNRTGVAGGCPNCKIIVAKAMNKDLFGYHDDIAEAIIWSADRGAKVINLSLGGTVRTEVIENAVNYARRKGAVLVAAGGNYGNSKPVYPAAYPGVIGVSHTDRYNRRVFDASYGSWIDVAAPGYDIVSTVPGGYAYKNGSSIAAPHVSAVAGLLSGKGYGKKAINRRIVRSAQDLGARGRDRYYGAGLIRPDRAVR